MSRDRLSLIKAFVTYVRPLLEYNSVIWASYFKYDIEGVEQFQRRFTKRLLGLRNYSYTDCFELLNLSSVELRRIHSDLAWCYKIVFGLTILKFDDFFQCNTAPQSHGHPYRLYKANSCLLYTSDAADE